MGRDTKQNYKEGETLTFSLQRLLFDRPLNYNKLEDAVVFIKTLELY